jgi:parallel beta-helix repeat protein
MMMETKKLLTVGIILLFIGTAILPSSGQKIEKTFSASRGNWLYVGGSGPENYTKIQDAVNASSDGDTVFVYDDLSPYYEYVFINKSITLLGEDKNSTIIQADYGPAVYIAAEEVKTSQFTIKGGKYNGIDVCSDFVTIVDTIIDSNSLWGGIALTSSHNNISYNSFYQSGLAVSSSNSSQNTVYHNTVNNKPLVYLENKSDVLIDEDNGQIILIGCNNISIRNQTISNASFGVHLMNTDTCFISNNTISDNWGGIYLFDSSSNNTVSDNYLTNDHFGIYTESSNGNIISNNTITSGFFGLPLCDSRNNIISNNTITSCDEYGIYMISTNSNVISGNSLCGNSGGIEVGDSKGNVISNNTIFKNGGGIFLWGSKDNIISYNVIRQNSGGVSIYEGCVRNKVFRNDISNNSRYGVEVLFCRNNKIYCNNIYGNIDHDAYIWNFGIFFYSNKWYRNYWGWSPLPFLPKPVLGTWKLLLFYEFPWFVFDWHPAKKPYNIPGMS